MVQGIPMSSLAKACTAWAFGYFFQRWLASAVVTAFFLRYFLDWDLACARRLDRLVVALLVVALLVGGGCVVVVVVFDGEVG